MNKPEYIIIHHSLTKDGLVPDWPAIRKYHIEHNGWSEIGYHLGIEVADGIMTVQTGRKMSEPGAHTKELGMNHRSVGICVVGNYDLIPPSIAHLHMLRDLCWAIMVNWNIPVQKVIGHRDAGLMAGFDWKKGQYKTCPGTLFPMQGLTDMLSGNV